MIFGIELDTILKAIGIILLVCICGGCYLVATLEENDEHESTDNARG